MSGSASSPRPGEVPPPLRQRRQYWYWKYLDASRTAISCVGASWLEVSVAAGVLGACRDSADRDRRVWCTVPPAWGYALPWASGGAWLACSYRRGMCGHACSRSTPGGGTGRTARSRVIRHCAENWPRLGQALSGTWIPWGHGRCCADTPMPGLPPLNAAEPVKCGRSSLVGGGRSYLCGGITAPSVWTAGGYGSRSLEVGPSCGCPVCAKRVPKPAGRVMYCPYCGHIGHRDLLAAANIAARVGGGTTPAIPAGVMHRRVGVHLPGVAATRRDPRRRAHRRGARGSHGKHLPAPPRPAQGLVGESLATR